MSRPRFVAAVFMLLTVCCVASDAASAAPGDLDPTFSTDGKEAVFRTIYYYQEDVHELDFSDAAVQPNGRIIGSGEYGLFRVKPNGTEDLSFSDGYSSWPIAAVAIEPNGKIVAAGYTHDYYAHAGDFVVLRYNRDGTPDKGFGDGGSVMTDLGGHDDVPKAVAIQPDGKIVVAGYSVQLDSEDAPARDFAVARYDVGGTLDSSFSGDGLRTTDFGGADVARDIAIQSNGKIVVAGAAGGDLGVVRYMPDGTPDASFSGNGEATAGFADPLSPGGRAVALQPDGRILVAGGQDGEFALARFNPDGSLDRTFSSDGTVTTGGFAPASTYPPETAANDVVLQGDRILTAGTATGDFALARYLPDGELDPSFSGDGVLTTDFSQVDSASRILPQTNAVLVAGSTYSQDPKYGFIYDSGGLARYSMGTGPADADADGILDSSDLCPNVFQPGLADGCPVYERTLTLEIVERQRYAYLKATLAGQSACIDETHVDIYRVRRGHTKTIRADWIRQAGSGNRRLYRARVRKVPARFHTAVEGHLVPTIGRCSAAMSDVVRLRDR